MFRRILCATDLTVTCESALRMALDLARQSDAALELLHVVEPPYALKGFWSPITQGEQELLTGLAQRHEDAARRLMAEQLAKLAPPGQGAVRTTYHVRHGVPSDVITSTAAELGVELVVTGTHARTGIRHALLGSIAERVARTAPCPVLIARSK